MVLAKKHVPIVKKRMFPQFTSIPMPALDIIARPTEHRQKANGKR